MDAPYCDIFVLMSLIAIFGLTLAGCSGGSSAPVARTTPSTNLQNTGPVTSPPEIRPIPEPMIPITTGIPKQPDPPPTTPPTVNGNDAGSTTADNSTILQRLDRIERQGREIKDETDDDTIQNAILGIGSFLALAQLAKLQMKCKRMLFKVPIIVISFLFLWLI